uniref:F-box domain-containing protein n=1 Tax=Mycena chlorophos TaxID=658473 RepID=A0ABQ0KZR3_MYCCL|nr:predicted protein [Mycena chlorophos]
MTTLIAEADKPHRTLAPASMSLDSFPPELIEHIVECIPNAADLRTAALVHPVFLPWVRTAVFGTIRLTQANVYAFRKLVDTCPDVIPYIRTLNIPVIGGRFTTGATVGAGTLAKLTAMTRLKAHADPFDFRNLSAWERANLREGVKGLISVELMIDKLYPLPYWATLLDSCSALEHLDVQTDSNGWGMWTSQEVQIAIPKAEQSLAGRMRLRSLSIAGDVKLLTPLAAWLLPRGALNHLYSLELDVYYLYDEYGNATEDRRLPLVRAVMPNVRELTLHLDPPMPLDSASGHISLSAFPQLQTLYMRDGPDAELPLSLTWLASFLSLPPRTQHPALQYITLDHSILRRDLLSVPHATWVALENSLINSDSDAAEPPLPALKSLTFANPHKFSGNHPDSVPAEERVWFEEHVGDRMPRIAEVGVLKFGGDVNALRERMWGRGMVN